MRALLVHGLAEPVGLKHFERGADPLRPAAAVRAARNLDLVHHPDQVKQPLIGNLRCTLPELAHHLLPVAHVDLAAGCRIGSLDEVKSPLHRLRVIGLPPRLGHAVSVANHVLHRALVAHHPKVVGERHRRRQGCVDDLLIGGLRQAADGRKSALDRVENARELEGLRVVPRLADDLVRLFGAEIQGLYLGDLHREVAGILDRSAEKLLDLDCGPERGEPLQRSGKPGRLCVRAGQAGFHRGCASANAGTSRARLGADPAETSRCGGQSVNNTRERAAQRPHGLLKRVGADTRRAGAVADVADGRCNAGTRRAHLGHARGQAAKAGGECGDALRCGCGLADVADPERNGFEIRCDTSSRCLQLIHDADERTQGPAGGVGQRKRHPY